MGLTGMYIYTSLCYDLNRRDEKVKEGNTGEGMWEMRE